MGGMIVQLLAIEHPGRVRSLTSIMSTTGDPEVGEASDAAIALLMAPPAATREAVIEGAVLSNRVMGSPSYPTAPDEVRARAARAFDRAYDPAGFARQLQACLTTPDRTEALRRLDVPALVVHGAADPLIGVSGGRATAAAIPGSELLVIDGVGHELPEAVWPAVVDRIAELVLRAEPSRAAAALIKLGRQLARAAGRLYRAGRSRLAWSPRECPRRTGGRPWTGSNVSNRDSRMPSPPVRSGSCSWSSWSREETRRTSSWLRSSPVVWDTTSAPHRVTTR